MKTWQQKLEALYTAKAYGPKTARRLAAHNKKLDALRTKHQLSETQMLREWDKIVAADRDMYEQASGSR